jgi:hypothetical protein
VATYAHSKLITITKNRTFSTKITPLKLSSPTTRTG